MSLDKFISKTGDTNFVSPCITCRHAHKGPTCDAFPHGIPEPILRGEHVHREKYPGQDNDIVYEPVDSGE
jgi:hypothetical protein